jgi:transposase
MKGLRSILLSLVDLVMLPFVAIGGVILWAIRRFGLQRVPLCRGALVYIGVLPVRRHYYEPFVSRADLEKDPAGERSLPGIDWNISGQLAFLSQLTYAGELSDLRMPRTSQLDFRFGNDSFESGDAEYLYQFVRATKPRRIFEIGSGQSTLLAHRAVVKNAQELPDYNCKHVCIEPFEAPWLEKVGVTTIRRKVEDVNRDFFSELESGDLLFIDSSHIIRPQGDVLTEYLEILPRLKAGVTVHIHDVFSPWDYPQEWLFEKMLLWNEQYLLEAFLTGNDSWQVVGALNLLARRHPDRLQKVCPYLTPDRLPGSFYIRKTRP